MATRSVQQRDLPAAPLLVLIVDSDDDTRALYRETLSLTGWNVVEGLDGRDALAKALMHPPNLVVTELFLPFIDGFALCEILRRDRRTASIRILVVTGESRPDQLSRAQNFADGVLVKPSTPQMLVNEITRLTSPGYERREHAASTSGNAGDAAQSRRQTALSKAHSRITTSSPPTVPLTLTCPSCDRSLVYVQSH